MRVLGVESDAVNALPCRLSLTQVGAAPGPAQLGFQPVVGAREERRVRHVRPRLPEVAPQEPQPVAQRARVPAPPQQPEPFPPQPRHQSFPYETGVRLLDRPHHELHRAQPLHAPRHQVPVHPRDLVTLGVTPVVNAMLDDPYLLRQHHTWLGTWQARAAGHSLGQELALSRDGELQQPPDDR